MFVKTKSARAWICNVALAIASALSAQALGQYTVIYSFHGGTDGFVPIGGMVADTSGNLYGTTEFGGIANDGTVFKLAKGTGGTWSETVLFVFSNGPEGGQPVGALIRDAAGNLYGTTSAGGDPNCVSHYKICGVVFELSANQNGTWTETVLHSFTGPDGLSPQSGLTFDSAGNLYGTTYLGGAYGCGEVFELSPNNNGTWSETVIHSFKQDGGGANPNSTPVFDGKGNLYGTTLNGGKLAFCAASFGCGTVFELTPQSNGTWTSATLHAFDEKHGADPVGISFDSLGNLYGSAFQGGLRNCELTTIGCGTVFRLTPAAGGGWQGGNIQFFNGSVQAPNPVIVDRAGNIFGTSFAGGISNCRPQIASCGTIFELIPTVGGYSLSVLYQFTGATDGFNPTSRLTMDGSGNLYGTAQQGGDQNCASGFGCGVVFQIVP